MTSKLKTAPKIEICSIVEGIVYYLKNLLMTPHLDSHSTTDPTPEILKAVLTGNRIQCDETSMKLYGCEAIEFESVEEVSIGFKSVTKL